MKRIIKRPLGGVAALASLINKNNTSWCHVEHLPNTGLPYCVTCDIWAPLVPGPADYSIAPDHVAVRYSFLLIHCKYVSG